MRIVVGGHAGRFLEIVLRNEREQRPREIGQLVFVGGDQMRDAALRGVGRRAAELFERHVFSGDGLDDLRSGDEHLRDLIGHER